MRKPNDCLQTVRPRAGQTQQGTPPITTDRCHANSPPTATASRTASRRPPPATAEPLPLIQVLLPHLRGVLGR